VAQLWKALESWSAFARNKARLKVLLRRAMMRQGFRTTQLVFEDWLVAVKKEDARWPRPVPVPEP
jgi:hypothetical protein